MGWIGPRLETGNWKARKNPNKFIYKNEFFLKNYLSLWIGEIVVSDNKQIMKKQPLK